MNKLTCDDAFTLALIVQKPDDNADLIEMLSSNAKPIGLCVTGQAKVSDFPSIPSLQESVDSLIEWATITIPKDREKAKKELDRKIAVSKIHLKRLEMKRRKYG